MALDKDKFINSYRASISKERADQKLVYRRAKDFYECNSKAHLEKILSPLFSDYAEISDEIIFREMGLTKGIVDNISLVYSEKPDRKYTLGDNDVGEKLTDYINEIYEGIGNSLFQMHEKLVNTFSHCSVIVSYDQTDGVKVRIITPDNYDVVQDEFDYTKATAYYMALSTQDDMTVKQDITKFIYIDNDIMNMVDVGVSYNQDTIIQSTAISVLNSYPLPDSETEENPYGIIPIVTTTSQEQVNKFFVDQNARLFSTGEEVLITKDVSSNKTSFTQGYSILVKTQNGNGYTDGTIGDSVLIAPDVMQILKNGIKGGQEAEKMEYISPSTDLRMLNDDMKDTYLQIAAIFGLGESEGNVKANASGLSLVVSDDKKNKLINASRPTYVKFEKKLFDIIRRVNNVHSSIKIPDNVEINVNFQEINTTVGLQDQIDLEQHDIDNDLRSLVKILMDRDKELTEEQAKKQINDAVKEKAEMRKSLNEMTNQDNEEEIGEE